MQVVWEIELPLEAFKARHAQLSSSPVGLELTDVYVLTVDVDAGLELNRAELIALDPEAVLSSPHTQ